MTIFSGLYIQTMTSAAEDLEAATKVSSHTTHQLSPTALQSLNIWANATSTMTAAYNSAE